jgi:hypothetical protein
MQNKQHEAGGIFLSQHSREKGMGGVHTWTKKHAVISQRCDFQVTQNGNISRRVWAKACIYYLGDHLRPCSISQDCLAPHH